MNKQELARRIVRDMGYEYQTVRNIIDGIAFEGWLHDPDQVPGRAITESCYRELTDSCSVNYQVGFSDGFFLAGGSIVPDPKPTNAEKLEVLIDDWREEIDPGVTLVEWLVERGVKAPGGDDEH